MLDSQVRRLLNAYPAIYLACHRRHLRDDATGRTVTAHQASILDHLHSIEATTLSKLAEHMGIGRSAMSIGVAKLVRQRYIVRSRAVKDRRVINLCLTPQGERLRDQNSFLDPALIKRMFQIVGPADLEAALSGLTTLANAARILLKRRSRSRNR